MKKLLLIIGLMLATSVSYAQQLYVTNGMAAGLRTLINESVIVNSITLVGTSNTIVRIYDGSATNVIAATTNYTVFPTNIVTTYIGPTGVTNNWTNQVIYMLASAVAQTTNNTPPLISLAVSAAQQPITYPGPFILSRYVNVSNDNGGLGLILNYRQP